MAGADYSTAIIKNGQWLGHAVSSVAIEGIKVLGYKYSIELDGEEIEKVVKNIRGKKKKVFTDIISSPRSKVCLFDYKEVEFLYFPETNILGGATLLYAFTKAGDRFLVATGYGHWQNPLLHYIGRGFSPFAIRMMAEDFWLDAAIEISCLLRNSDDISDGLMNGALAPRLQALLDHFERMADRGSERYCRLSGLKGYTEASYMTKDERERMKESLREIEEIAEIRQ